MMINVNEIVGINGIYISQLYRDWYAVEVIAKRKNTFFRIRYPYCTLGAAQNALEQIKQKSPNVQKPDYRPVIYLMDQGKVK